MSGETNGLLIPDEVIMNKIYYIRGQKVMLDSDLAELYGVETRRLNEQVARNADRFPQDFMFRLNENEFESLMSQFATSKRGGRRKLPYMFSEHGVLMLSSILNSKQAIQVNIQVMRIFTRIRQMFVDNTEIRLDIEKIKNKLDNQDKNMEIVFKYLDELLEKQERPNPPRKRIGFKPDDL
ncbi:ORF6N domain-containing protein [Pedobacter jejuensis]|uniref:ORF6N domain-containing protein n=1 Tax=Pedobacter jejuensis TaxID=1268550 RepID=A0A3N0BTR7_9SPHI|nr:ORF6N domain-containing protein [Pedobacter jejuensis]RNL52489.1 ORF6N domain-containing protein [Pedobacter jejuensis]